MNGRRHFMNCASILWIASTAFAQDDGKFLEQNVPAPRLAPDRDQPLPAAPVVAISSESTLDKSTHAESVPVTEVRVFTLKHASAVDCAALLGRLFPSARLSADIRTNNLLAVSTQIELDDITAILIRIDREEVSAAMNDRFTGAIDVIQSTDPDRLQTAIAEYEARAAQLTTQFRQSAARKGASHPEQIKTREELKKTLSEALEIKLQAEDVQIRKLQFQLSRLQAQHQMRKAASQKIVERRMKELIDGDPLDWTPAASFTSSVSGPKSALPVEPTPTRTPVQSNPNASNPPRSEVVAPREPVKEPVDGLPYGGTVTEVLSKARAQVRQFEDEYFRNGSQAADLKTAFDQLHSLVTQLVLKPFPTSPEAAAWAKLESLGRPVGKSLPVEYHTMMGMAVLESHFAARLDFVKLQDLNLPFPAALRVRETQEELSGGDLIVSVAGHTFGSIDEAVAAILVRGQSESIVFSGGLSGEPRTLVFRSQLQKYFIPTPPQQTSFNFEVQIQDPKSEGRESKYLQGICVAPDGLVVLPLLAKSLATDSTIVIYEPLQGTSRIVASDESSGLSLVKLEIPNRQLFPWSKCQAAPPVTKQQFTLPGNANETYLCAIQETDLSLPAPWIIKDAFSFRFQNQKKIAPGSPLISVNMEVMGMTVDATTSRGISEVGAADTAVLLAVPATHIQKLIRSYRKSFVEQKETTLAAKEQQSESIVHDQTNAVDVIFSNIGLRLAPVTDRGVIPKPFLGALRVVNVNPSLVPRVLPGDLLLGLHRWQSTSIDDAVFALRQGQSKPEFVFKSSKLLAVLCRRDRVFCEQVGSAENLRNLADLRVSGTAELLSPGAWLTLLQHQPNPAHLPEIAWLAIPLANKSEAPAMVEAVLKSSANLEMEKMDEVCKLLLNQEPPTLAGPIARVLSDGPAPSRLMALSCISNLKDFLETPEIPDLVKCLLAIAAGDLGQPDVFGVRSMAISLLARGLPVTSLKPEELSTPARQQMAKRMIEILPHDAAVDAIVKGLEATEVYVRLAAVEGLARNFDNIPDPSIHARTINTLIEILKGKIRDQEVNVTWRGMALKQIEEIGEEAAVALPALVELLKSDDKDLRSSNTSFTPDQVITVIERIAPGSKDARIQLQDAVKVIERKEREDRLLFPERTGDAGARSEAVSSQLRRVIDRLGRK